MRRRQSRLLPLALLLTGLLSWPPAVGSEEPEDDLLAEDWTLDDFGEPAWELGGDLKLLGIGYDLPDAGLGVVSGVSGQEWSGYTSLRLKLEGSPSDWLGYEVHAQLQHDHHSVAGLTTLADATETVTTLFRGLGDAHTFSESARDRLWGEVDYANVRFTCRRADLTIGRQAVTFGRSFFWNPTDWLSTFTPTEIDREYKGGVDAARLSLGLGRFSGVELLYAYGEDGAWDSSALIARVFGNLGGWDLELLGGHVWIDSRLGFAFSGDVGGAGLRGELSWHRPTAAAADQDDFLRATVEADYRWESSLHLVGELHYNGFGSNNPEEYGALLMSPRLLTGQVSNVGRCYLGSQLSYELTPLLTGTGAVLVNLDDGSGLVNPSFSLSLSDESDLVAGAIIPWGRKQQGLQLRSEYGAYFKALWLQWRWTF